MYAARFSAQIALAATAFVTVVDAFSPAHTDYKRAAGNQVILLVSVLMVPSPRLHSQQQQWQYIGSTQNSFIPVRAYLTHHACACACAHMLC